MTAPIEVPDHLPLVEQDIDIMRCVLCGAIEAGTWGVTVETGQAGIDHLLTRHRADVVAYTVPLPPFVNCAVQDPFWFEEHVPEDDQDAAQAGDA